MSHGTAQHFRIPRCPLTTLHPSLRFLSQDIMMRWSFPLVPDSNFDETSTYSYRRKHVYVEDGVVLARYV